MKDMAGDYKKSRYRLKSNTMVLFLTVCAAVIVCGILTVYGGGRIIVAPAVLAAVGIAVCIIFFKKIYLPVKKLEALMMRSMEGRELGISDIGGVSENSAHDNDTQLDRITGELRDLIMREYSAKMMKKQAELNALQSQINPHFLYNTLEAIRGQAIVAGITDIEIMTKALADMFRYSISTTRVIISFEEELVNVDNYLKIQQYRFSNRFSIIKEIDEDVLDFRMPKLLIQPIVENAFQHGVERKRGRGHIHIAAYCTDEHFIISIRDDGPGMELAQLDRLNGMLNESVPPEKSGRGGSIGLLNVNERIKMIYGANCGVRIYSALNVGTCVELRLKKVLQEK